MKQRGPSPHMKPQVASYTWRNIQGPVLGRERRTSPYCFTRVLVLSFLHVCALHCAERLGRGSSSSREIRSGLVRHQTGPGRCGEPSAARRQRRPAAGAGLLQPRPLCTFGAAHEVRHPCGGRPRRPTHALPPGRADLRAYTHAGLHSPSRLDLSSVYLCPFAGASRSIAEFACFFDRNAGLACDVFMTSLLAGLAGRPPGPSDPVQ